MAMEMKPDRVLRKMAESTNVRAIAEQVLQLQTRDAVRKGEMKALTILQPYAHFIWLGQKPMENRSWETRYRGPLAIHAGKGRSMLDHDDLTEYPEMVFGAVIAVAQLVDCVRFERLSPELQRHEHANGPWCWMLEDVRRVKPVTYRGAQGLWEIDVDFEYLEAA